MQEEQGWVLCGAHRDGADTLHVCRVCVCSGLTWCTRVGVQSREAAGEAEKGERVQGMGGGSQPCGCLLVSLFCKDQLWGK